MSTIFQEFHRHLGAKLLIESIREDANQIGMGSGGQGLKLARQGQPK